MAKNKKTNYVYAVGRRKEASARVRLFSGKGENTVNGILIEKYFPGSIFKEIWSKPFKAVDSSDKYFITVKVNGGGKKSQVDAVSHATSRTFFKLNKENKKALRNLKLLTRDSRIRERRKVGMGGKSRRQKQSPKR